MKIYYTNRIHKEERLLHLMREGGREAGREEWSQIRKQVRGKWM